MEKSQNGTLGCIIKKIFEKSGGVYEEWKLASTSVLGVDVCLIIVIKCLEDVRLKGVPKAEKPGGGLGTRRI